MNSYSTFPHLLRSNFTYMTLDPNPQKLYHEHFSVSKQRGFYFHFLSHFIILYYRENADSLPPLSAKIEKLVELVKPFIILYTKHGSELLDLTDSLFYFISYHFFLITFLKFLGSV